MSEITAGMVKAELERIRSDVSEPVHALSNRVQQMEQVIARGEHTAIGGFAPESAASAAVRNLHDMPEVQRVRDAVASGMSPGRFSARVTLDSGIRAAITNPGVGQVGDTSINGVRDRRPDIVTSPQAPLRLLDVLPSRRVSGNEVEYLQASAGGTAGEQMKEGDLKTQVPINAQLKTAKIATVAAWTKASRQILSDQDQLESVIGRLLGYQAMRELERLILNGDGTTSRIDGLLHQAPLMTPTIATPTAAADVAGEAIMGLSSAGYVPSALVLHPRDWFRMQLVKTTTGEYVNGSPTEPVPPSLWNTPVVLSPSMPQDTGLVIDAAFVSLLDRWQTQVMVATENEDDFIRNRVTILAELRAGLEVADPMALLKFDLGQLP